MSSAKENMLALEQDPVTAQEMRRSERWRYWRVYRWLLLSVASAGLLIAMGYFGPGDPLNTVILWTGIVGLVCALAQGIYTGISMWSYRAGLELYFEAKWNRCCADRGDQIPSGFRKWRRAQGWRFWWKVLQKNRSM